MAISPMGGYGGIMHTHENTQAVLNRMSRAIGHMTAVKRMIEELSAVKSEITGVSKVILKEHIGHCIVDAVHENDDETVRQLLEAIDKLV